MDILNALLTFGWLISLHVVEIRVICQKCLLNQLKIVIFNILVTICAMGSLLSGRREESEVNGEEKALQAMEVKLSEREKEKDQDKE